MSKQVYIDSDGNEIQVSGTVNSADILPVEAGSSKMTSEAIGDLSTQQTITPTFNTQQSNYSIPYNNTSVVKIGKMVMCMVNPRCLSPYGSYPGALVYSGLPKPVDGLNHYFTFNDWKGKQYEPIRFMLSASGELYLRNGQTDSEYDGSFVYISE